MQVDDYAISNWWLVVMYMHHNVNGSRQKCKKYFAIAMQVRKIHRMTSEIYLFINIKYYQYLIFRLYIGYFKTENTVKRLFNQPEVLLDTIANGN